MKSSRILSICALLFFAGSAWADGLPRSSASTCSLDYPLTFIHAVQGSGPVSPFDGEMVMVEGVVVGDFQDGGLGVNGDLDGFYVQEEDTDLDVNPATSEGVFVYDGVLPATDVAVGDLICIVGQVQEYFDETQINATVVGSLVVVASSGHALPTARTITLPVSNTIVSSTGVIGDCEAYEGERVRVVGPLTVTATHFLDDYGELTLSSGGRLVAFTQIHAPSVAGFAAWNEDQARRSLRLDDGLMTPNPDPIPYPPPALSLINRLRAGDQVDDLIGTIRYSRGAGAAGDEVFRLMPTDVPTFVTENPRPPHPPAVGGDVKVASFNIERYYNGSGGTGSGFPTIGASTFAEFLRQRDKVIATIAEMDADIVGIAEVENDYPEDLESAIRDLVDGLNAVLGAGTYAYRDPGVMLSTAPITVGLLYKPATVVPVGPLVYLDTPAFANPNGYAFHLNRPALTQTFQTAIGAFTVSVNHFKAKGNSPTSMGLDADLGDGQAYFNDTRTKGAAELVRWLATDPTNTAATLGAVDPDFLIIGDLNAHPMEDPIAAIKAGPDGTSSTADDYVDLLSIHDHSFVFQGAQSRLDYALASPSLATQIAGAQVWSINADEPDAFDYNEELPAPAALYAPDPFRSSDHDPVLVDITSEAMATVIDAVKAKGNKKGVRLDWQTSREVNNVGFEVQHQQGQAWDVLGFVEGTGTTAKPQKYRWFAKDLEAGMHYFRLKQINHDGRFQYSEVVSAHVKGKKQARAHLSQPFPNPFNPQTGLTLTVAESQQVRVAAYDMLGREVALLFEGRLAAEEMHPITFTAGHLPTGTYIIRARGETFATATRVVLLK